MGPKSHDGLVTESEPDPWASLRPLHFFLTAPSSLPPVDLGEELGQVSPCWRGNLMPESPLSPQKP